MLHVSFGKHDSNFRCRRCLHSYSSQIVLFNYKHTCYQQEITAFKTSHESHLIGKKHFHKKPSHFRIWADFGADNEIDVSCLRKNN